MLVTPGTEKSNGGTASPPAAAQNGSTQPPTHASTCTGTPRAAAASAPSAPGSAPPWGSDGAGLVSPGPGPRAERARPPGARADDAVPVRRGGHDAERDDGGVERRDEVGGGGRPRRRVDGDEREVHVEVLSGLAERGVHAHGGHDAGAPVRVPVS